MAIETREFAVSVPNTATAANPQVTALTMPSRRVRHIRLRFPPGPAGEVGCRLTSGGKQVIPTNDGAWLIGEDEVFELDPTSTLTSGAWQLTLYNTGTYSHTLFLTFLLDPVQADATAQPNALLDPASLAGSGSLPN